MEPCKSPEFQQPVLRYVPAGEGSLTVGGLVESEGWGCGSGAGGGLGEARWGEGLTTALLPLTGQSSNHAHPFPATLPHCRVLSALPSFSQGFG